MPACPRDAPESPAHPPAPSQDGGFDALAASYSEALAEGLRLSGESQEYFAGARVAWLRHCLRGVDWQGRSVLDFGCGTGSATPFLRDMLRPAALVGTDISIESIKIAQARHGAAGTRFVPLGRYHPRGCHDLVFCNGVFHHIPPDRRAGSMAWIARSLRPGGHLALWENNPWSPAARLVMSRIPFDRNAVLVWPGAARRLAREAGLEPLGTSYHFVFPHTFRALRWSEPFLRRLPVGAQYQVLARRP